MATRSTKVVVRPVTEDSWDDFARLFEARGSPHYCWCSPYRFAGAHEMDGKQKRAAMRRLIAGGTPVGVIAFAAGGGDPVGWCSIAPRESYVKLGRSRSMPRRTAADVPTWTVLCLFVVRAARGTGVARALLDGAVKYARGQGARVIEGYPHDSAGTTATHRGRASLFAAAGFHADGARWVRETPRARARP
jgi:GNAT superfamily N-acetyltransferase